MTALNPVLDVGRQIGEVLSRHRGLRGARRARAHHRAAGACRHGRSFPALQGLSPSALRWHEAARDDRHGTGRRARDVDRRRADHGAGCHHPGPGAGAAARAAAAKRHGDPAHYPRSWRGGGDGGPGSRDVRRTDRGAGVQHELLRRSSPSLQPKAVRVCSGRREARARAGSHSRDGTFSAPGIAGCRFAERCPSAWDLCRNEVPPWSGTGRFGTRCHLQARDAPEPHGPQTPGASAALAPAHPDFGAASCCAYAACNCIPPSIRDCCSAPAITCVPWMGSTSRYMPVAHSRWWASPAAARPAPARPCSSSCGPLQAPCASKGWS